MTLFERANAAPAIPGLEVMNPFQIKRVLGTLIGGFVGFFVGGLIFIALLFFVHKNFLFLLPVLAVLGIFVGGFLSALIGRGKSPGAGSP